MPLPTEFILHYNYGGCDCDMQGSWVYAFLPFSYYFSLYIAGEVNAE
jgi:hypothetical protein